MENINRYIKWKNNDILKSSFDFKGLFNLIHSQEDRIFAEYIKNYQVKKISYNEMKSYCLKMASFISARIVSDDNKYVGLYMENSVNWVACFWGILASGYKPVLLNCKLPREINDDIIVRMGIKTVVLGNKAELSVTNVIQIEKTNDFIPEILSLEEIKADEWGNQIALSTTATSTNYKICVYSGENITYQVLNANGVLKKNKDVKGLYQGYLKQLCFLPFYHIFGLIATYFWFAVFGRSFVFLNDYSSDTIFKTIQRTNVTHLFAVPLLWNTLARGIKKEINNLPAKEKEKALKAISFSLAIQNLFPGLGIKIARKMFTKVCNQTMGLSIRFLITGGGYVSDETLRIINGVGYPLYNGYGSTEIGITSVELRKPSRYRLQGSVGKPFDSVCYDIKDGILFVKGKSTCSEIIEKNGNVTTLSQNDFFKTNDVATVDKTGSYFISGRTDDVFVGINGEKINPDLVEKKCMFTTVDHYSILSYENELTLIFEYHNTSNEFRSKQVACEISKAVDALYSEGIVISKVFYTTDNMINPNAIKVSRTILIKKIAAGDVKLIPFENFKIFTNKSVEEIKNDTICKIKDIFADVLGKTTDEIDVNKHFIFDLGGTSLDYCSLLMKLNNEFGFDFRFENQSSATVLEFWQYIENKENEEKKQ